MDQKPYVSFSFFDRILYIKWVFDCSSTYYDDSLSMSNGNQTDVLPPPTSLILNNKDEEVRSYSEQSSFSNGCLRIGRILLIIK
jgi:hypothetical protein